MLLEFDLDAWNCVTLAALFVLEMAGILFFVGSAGLPSRIAIASKRLKADAVDTGFIP